MNEAEYILSRQPDYRTDSELVAVLKRHGYFTEKVNRVLKEDFHICWRLCNKDGKQIGEFVATEDEAWKEGSVAPDAQPSTPSPEPLAPEVMYCVYARYKGTEKWFQQESSTNKEDVIYWAQRNNERNAETYVGGAGREYIAVKATTTFETL